MSFHGTFDQTTGKPVFFVTKGDPMIDALKATGEVKVADDDTKARSAMASFEIEQKSVALAKMIITLGSGGVARDEKQLATQIRAVQTALTANDSAQAVEMFQLLKQSGLLDGKMRAVK